MRENAAELRGEGGEERDDVDASEITAGVPSGLIRERASRLSQLSGRGFTLAEKLTRKL